MLSAEAISDPLYSIFGGDPEMGELVEAFIDRVPARRRTLCELFAEGNWNELERVAHQLKGAAGSYGFDMLTDVAARLEQVVKTRETHAVISQALEAVVICCDRCRAGAPDAIAR